MSANSNLESTTFRFGTSFVIICLCFMATTSNAEPLLRSQRQAMSRDLASGLTNTGTSFNSFYDYQNASGYMPEQRNYTSFYENGVTKSPVNNRLDNDLYGMGYGRSNLGGYGIGQGRSVGYEGGIGEGYPDRPYNYGMNTGYGVRNWRGFGRGVRPISQSQYGIKY